MTGVHTTWEIYALHVHMQLQGCLDMLCILCVHVVCMQTHVPVHTIASPTIPFLFPFPSMYTAHAAHVLPIPLIPAWRHLPRSVQPLAAPFKAVSFAGNERRC